MSKHPLNKFKLYIFTIFYLPCVCMVISFHFNRHFRVYLVVKPSFVHTFYYLFILHPSFFYFIYEYIYFTMHLHVFFISLYFYYVFILGYVLNFCLCIFLIFYLPYICIFKSHFEYVIVKPSFVLAYFEFINLASFFLLPCIFMVALFYLLLFSKLFYSSRVLCLGIFFFHVVHFYVSI